MHPTRLNHLFSCSATVPRGARLLTRLAFSVALAAGVISLSGPTRAQSCPSHAPLYCGPGCCPYGDGGRTDVCCPNNMCTSNGNCGGGGGGGDQCPDHAPLSCGSGCCPYGDGGRTDVCCPNNMCTSNGLCGGDDGGGDWSGGGGDSCPPDTYECGSSHCARSGTTCCAHVGREDISCGSGWICTPSGCEPPGGSAVDDPEPELGGCQAGTSHSVGVALLFFIWLSRRARATARDTSHLASRSHNP